MLKIVLSGVVRSQFNNTIRPSVIVSALRKDSSKPCPPKSVPHIPEVCWTEAASQGRTDKDLDACLYESIANKTPLCTTKAFEAFPCKPLKKPKTNGGMQYTFMEKSAWEKPPCCGTSVVKELRHDVEYLKERVVCRPQRTWYEFPQRCKVKKQVCKQQKLSVPPMEIRPRGQINKAPTKAQPPIDFTNKKCPKIKLPGCRKVKLPLKCVAANESKCCKKRCTQYPAFSECCHKPVERKKNSECGCLDSLSMCQVRRPDLFK